KKPSTTELNTKETSRKKPSTTELNTKETSRKKPSTTESNTKEVSKKKPRTKTLLPEDSPNPCYASTWTPSASGTNQP
ncbi:salivary glue protein Sgs-3, partial [Bacteroides sp. 1_1_14]